MIDDRRIAALDHAEGRDWAFYRGDCVEVVRQLPDNSVGMALYSPPFANLYTYSDDPRDMGNCEDDAEFLRSYRFLVDELHRVLRPGRLCVVHAKDLVNYKGRDGMAGLRDFPGDLIRVHQAAGFAFHSRVTIWKDPVVEMQRTKAHGLLYAQLRRDSTFSRQGLAEYVLVFRKWADEEGTGVEPVTHTKESFPLDRWQEWASPVWNTIRQTHVLNVELAREDRDEKHMCLAAGSLVCTRDGYLPIEDVAVGDLVLTHRGRWRPVKAKAALGKKAVVRAAAQGVPNLILTPDHRLWTRVGRTSHPRKIARSTEPTWTQAQDTLGSYLHLPLPPVEDSPLSHLEWWAIGRWLGDGHRDTRGRLHISCAFEELEGLRADLGALAGAVANAGTCAQIALKDRSGRLRSIIDRCGHGAAGKRLPAEALALEPGKAESLLTGYLSADGHYVEKHERWMATSVSRALVLGMAMVAQRARGVVATVIPGRKGGRRQIEGRDVTTRDEWVLDIPPRNLSAMLLDDGAWKKVRSLDAAGEAEVWDLQVEEDESFVAEGCSVHNCPLQLDVIERAVVLWSNAGDVVLSPYGGIGSEGVGALQLGRKFVGVELKESYFRHGVENLRAASAQASMPLFGGGRG
jgi:hypothetical protein